MNQQSSASALLIRRLPSAGLRIPVRVGRWLLLTAALLGWNPNLGLATDAPKSLRDVLSPEEFRRAGLQKLTEAELEFLSSRLLPDATALSPPAARPAPAKKATIPMAEGAPEPFLGEAAFGQETQLRDAVEKTHRIPESITSRIAGQFRGWTGSTVFHLENGQIWQQIDGSSFSVNLENPTVMIRKGLFGVFYLNVKGYGSSIKVKRLR
jgi:hypothetical protein